MTFLSKRIVEAAVSETLAISQKSKELRAQGKDVINLAIGEPDFDTPEEVKAFAKKSIDENYSHYTPASGYLELQQAICHKLKRDNNLTYEPSQVVISNGAKHSIANAVMCIINPGDEVIIPTPFWVSYREIVKLAEGIPVYITASFENGYKITPQQLEAAITPKTKMVMFNSPSNPSGIIYTKEELQGFAKVIAKYPHVFVMTDEVYELVNFGGKHETIAQFEEIKEQVILINGVSKGFAMTGWRIGYMAANKAIAKACDKYQGHMTSAPSSIAQRAAIRAMEMEPEKSEYVRIMRTAFKERCAIATEALNQIKGIKVNKPEGALYLFPDVSYFYGKSTGNMTIKNSDDLCMYLLDTAEVALVPGSAFGEDKSLRLSIATSKELLLKAIARMKTALEALK